MPVSPDFLSTVDLLPEPMLLAGVDGRIVAVNRALSELMGMPRDTLESRLLADLVCDSWPEVNAYLQRCAASGRLIPGSLTLRRKSGDAYECRAAGAAW